MAVVVVVAVAMAVSLAVSVPVPVACACAISLASPNPALFGDVSARVAYLLPQLSVPLLAELLFLLASARREGGEESECVRAITAAASDTSAPVPSKLAVFFLFFFCIVFHPTVLRSCCNDLECLLCLLCLLYGFSARRLIDGPPSHDVLC